MEEQGSTQTGGAVNTADDTASVSATEEQTTEGQTEETTEASEKTEITQEGAEESTEERTEDSSLESEEKSVPYDRFKEVNDRAKEADRLEKQLVEYKAKAEMVDKFTGAAEKAERSPELQKADDQLQDMKYVREDQVEAMIDSKVAKRELGNKFMGQVEVLEKKYDGKDGSPKFVAEDVADFLDKKGYQPEEYISGKITLEDAYMLMNSEGIVDAKVKQKRGTVPSEKPGQPMSSSGTTNKTDFDEAKKTGDWTQVLLGRVGSPFKKGE